MMSGDGIYSRYLQHHLTTGRYKFTVSVDDNEGQAFYLSPPAPISSSGLATNSICFCFLFVKTH